MSVVGTMATRARGGVGGAAGRGGGAAARGVGAARGGVFVTLIPLFAALLSWLLLGETLRLYHLLGLCGLVIGIVLVNARQR